MVEGTAVSRSGKRPIVIAYHLVWAAYGCWLPNDPRGGMSEFVRNSVIDELGELHYGRKVSQPTSREIREFYDRAGGVLMHPRLEFGAADRKLVAEGIARAIDLRRYTCYALAVMRDHVHAIVRKHRDTAEEMIANLQGYSRLRLREAGARDDEHPVWGGPGWKVFLDGPHDVRRTIGYVEENPIKAGWGRQSYGFVKAYDNWPFHAGHSERSPYVRRMKGAE